METTALLCVIGVILLFGLLVYVVYINRKINQSHETIESFLSSLSRSFHCAHWVELTLNEKGDRSDEEIAQIINQKITKEMEYELMIVFRKCHSFPSRQVKLYIGDTTTKEFIDKIYPTLGILYKKYVQKKASLDQINKEFFTTTKEIILLQLAKESALAIAKE